MNDIPEVTTEPGRQGIFSAVSLVWLVPVAALGVALAVAWSSWTEQGPLIQIAFDDAAGIHAQETEVRYRNVAVGVVEDVSFTADLGQVLASVRLDKDVAPFVDDGAAFWIVQPEVTTSGVSGLETVLSGVYIEGTWDAEPGGTATRFTGLDQPPLRTTYRDGLLIELRSSRDSGLVENTPILFKGIEVGRLGRARISQDGNWVFADAIIFSPHDRLVTTATRFWDTSGFSFSLGPNGAELDFSSVASLIAGGITFDTIVSGGQTLRQGMVFEVFPSEAAARTSIFEDSDGETVTISMVFEDNISGLTNDAPVEWRGVRIGSVVNVTGAVDPARFGDARVRLLATAEITPARFGLAGDLSEEEALAYLADRVREGLRARLASASILTGGLKIELITDEDAPAASLQTAADPFPLFPVTDSEIADVSATAEGVFERVNALPIEELLSSAIAFLDNATAFVASDDLRETPGELRGLLSDARGVIGSDAVQTLPSDVQVLVNELQLASSDLRQILLDVREADAVARVLTAVDRAGSAAEAVNAALQGVPALTDSVRAFAETATALPLQRFVEEASGLATDARALVSTEAARALPVQITQAADALQIVLTDISENGAAARLSSALVAVEEAATQLNTASADVPDLARATTNLVNRINGLPLDQLVTDAAGLAQSANTLLSSDAAQGLPINAAAALSELESLLRSLSEADTTASVDAALKGAAGAAQAVETAVAGVPDVVARLDRIAANAESVRLDALGRELEQVLASSRALIDQTGDAGLPDALAGALGEAEAALEDLRQGGLIGSANATLASAQDAAASIQAAAENLPELVARLNATLSQATDTLEGYDGSSAFARETSSALREIERAAKSITDLARAIERRPNSIILGR